MQVVEECLAFKWLLSSEDAAAFGGLVKGLSQSRLFSEWWSQADFIEWPYMIPSNDTESHEASKRDALFLSECFAVERSKVFHVSAP